MNLPMVRISQASMVASGLYDVSWAVIPGGKGWERNGFRDIRHYHQWLTDQRYVENRKWKKEKKCV